MIDKARFAKLEKLYHRLAGSGPIDPAEFLTGTFDDDDELRIQVESLLKYEHLGDQFIDTSPEHLIAEAFTLDSGEQDKRTHIGRYRIIRLLGEGGMGRVFLAEDSRLDRRVALKVLPEKLIGDAKRLGRLEREAKAASALNHPNILTVYEFGEDDDVHFIATEFVDGKTLRDQMASLSAKDAVDVSLQIVSALAAAHAAGITHRDIKPENIMIRPDGIVKVLDFGLAKIKDKPILAEPEAETRALFKTRPGSIMGTEAYMSPEQARGQEVDARSDIWSLGVVLYEMLASRRPFTGETGADIMAAVLTIEPPPISSIDRSLPPIADQIVAKALSKNIDGRYQTAMEMRVDLAKLLERVNGSQPEQAVTDGEAATRLSIANVGAATADERRRRTGLSSLWPTTGDETARPITSMLLAATAVMSIALVAAIGYFSYAWFAGDGDADRSIAVLPFENATGDPASDAAADGLTGELIDKFAQLSQVRVISRNSTAKLKGSTASLASIASDLGVRTIVTGSVRRQGDELIVRVDVVDAASDQQLGGGEYRRPLDQIETLRNDIAKRTTDQLKLRLTGAEQDRLTRTSTENSDAYQAYLSGIAAADGTPAGRTKAINDHQRAVTLDPDFAAAYAELAWLYWEDANTSGDPSELMPKARLAVERSLAIDPELAKAHVTRAVVNEYDNAWAEAERSYLRAIELSPNLDIARNNYAFFLAVNGRLPEAIAQLDEQRLRDPLNMRMWYLQKAAVLVQGRRFDEALVIYRQVQESNPGDQIPNFAIGYALAGKAEHAAAVEYYLRSVETMGGENRYSQPLVYLAISYANMPDKRAEARQISTRIEAMPGYRSPALMAALYAALGENDRAFDQLDRAITQRDPLTRYIKPGYEYDPLRNDPRFPPTLTRIGL